MTEEEPRLVGKVRVLNFFRFLLFSRWWSRWLFLVYVKVTNCDKFLKIIKIQTLNFKSSIDDEESEYLCFLVCSGNFGISIWIISRVGWLFWGLENIISSSSSTSSWWCCVTGPSSAIDNFDRSVSLLLEMYSTYSFLVTIQENVE